MTTRPTKKDYSYLNNQDRISGSAAGFLLQRFLDKTRSLGIQTVNLENDKKQVLDLRTMGSEIRGRDIDEFLNAKSFVARFEVGRSGDTRQQDCKSGPSETPTKKSSIPSRSALYSRGIYLIGFPELDS